MRDLPRTERQHRYFSGLNYGRAFFAIAVVAWHALAFGEFDALSRPARPDLVGVIYLNVLVIAVPFFFAASLFLYANTWRPDSKRFGQRLVYLTILSAFWISVTWMIRGIGNIDLGKAPEFILSGGDTVFYFLVGLIWLTALVEVIMRAGLDARPRLLFALTAMCAAVMLLLGPVADALPGDKYLVNYWSPLNFVAYAPLAVLLASTQRKQLPGRLIAAAAAAYVALAVLEWLLLDNRDVGTHGVFLPSYSRPSLVLAAGLIVAVLIRGAWRPPPVVTWLASLSLGIYCIHPLLLEHAPAIWPDLYDLIGGSPFAVFLAVLATSIALTAAARSRRLF